MRKVSNSLLSWINVFLYTLVFYLPCMTGCNSQVLSSVEQVREFDKAGPLTSEGDIDNSIKVQSHLGPYRVVSGDVLELQMPVVLRVVSSEFSDWLKPVYGRKDYEPYLVRVSDAGTITLPIVGKLPAAGKTLSEIEALVIDAYYPKYVVNLPMVVCEVVKYRRENERVFTILGLVNRANAFPYPPDVQYNLMEALAFAGGLNVTADPRYVKVLRQNSDGQVVSATFGVDSKSLAEAYGVMIKPGDVIYVDHTLRTRMNQFLSDALQIRIGADVTRNVID
ncbi:MAG: polysaccharide biosynthesis/export family protein [Phycisphaerae bacterium]|nr:polysaccharide biosynthesis/export family protein [Phycisphaerae bacterium]